MTPTNANSGGWRARPWYIVGCGRVGRALGVIANRMDIPVEATWNRSERTARETEKVVDADRYATGDLPGFLKSVRGDDSSRPVIWVTVADEALSEVAARVGESAVQGALLVHTCGSRGLEVFGAPVSPVAVAHPLWAVSRPERAADGLGRATWSIEGSEEAREWLRHFLGELGARVVELSSVDRGLYHAAAVTAANLCVGALEAGVEMAQIVGFEREEAVSALWSLAMSALENVKDGLDAKGLTGPVARGDESTIQGHLDALRRTGDDELEAVYRSLTQMCRRIMDADDD